MLISLVEFSGLWTYIQDWQNVFRHFDRDQSGTIEGRELSEALRSFGYSLSPPLLTLVEQKYGEQGMEIGLTSKINLYIKIASGAAATAFGPPAGITFDRFVRACVVVKTLTEAFQRYILITITTSCSHTHEIHSADTTRRGWVELNYEQFMKVQYTPSCTLRFL
jgi:peflin